MTGDNRIERKTREKLENEIGFSRISKKGGKNGFLIMVFVVRVRSGENGVFLILIYTT